LLEVKLTSATDAVSLIREIIETRLDGMDIAIRLLQDTADKFPARIDEKIGSLRAVHEERFVSIQTQFAERDVRTEQAAGAVKIAVDAALQAQKEAVGEQNKSSALAIAKSETSTTKQIDQIGTLIQNNTKAFDDKISDVKDRVNRIEGMGAGAGALWGYALAALGILIGLSRFIK
jgi:ribosome maturation protein Sdo1